MDEYSTNFPWTLKVWVAYKKVRTRFFLIRNTFIRNLRLIKALKIRNSKGTNQAEIKVQL